MALLTRKELIAASGSGQYHINDCDEKELALSEINLRASQFHMDMTFDIFVSYDMEDWRVPLGLKNILNGKDLSVFVKNCDSEDKEINYRILENSLSILHLITFSAGPLNPVPWQMAYMADLGKRISIVPILDKPASLYGIETLWNYPYLDSTDNNLYVHKDSSSWISLENWLEGHEPKKFNLLPDL